MPGLNLYIGTPKNLACHSSLIDKVLKEMLHFNTYSHNKIADEDWFIFGLTAYDSYPRNIIKTDRFTIMLEGFIYNRTKRDLEKYLLKIASDLSIGIGSIERLNSFIKDSDGEFVIVIFDKKKKRLFIINDAMARLPLYYHFDESGFLIVSREIKFIIPLLRSIEFNKVALMEYLLYEFPFDDNTFIKSICRLRPATLISYDVKTNLMTMKNVRGVDFDREMVKRSSDSDLVSLRKFFLDGLKNRVDALGNRKPIITLSGGLDSRATLAGLMSLGVHPEAITIKDKRSEDVYAQEVADEFGINIKTFKVKENQDIEDYKRIVFLKDGLNITSHASQIQFLNQTINKYGNDIVTFTGMYGGENFRYSHPTRGFKSQDDLVDFLLTSREGYMYSPKNVCRMLRISHDDIALDLKNHLSSYNEKDISRKYLRFRFEKDLRWAGEGEDRYRFFSWTITPFYSTSFYEYATSMDENKKDLLFFRDFLYSLDPRTCNVKYYNNDMDMNDMWKLNVIRMEDQLVRHPKMRKIAKTILSTKGKLSKDNIKQKEKDIQEINNIKKILFDVLKESKVISKYFSYSDTKEIIQSEDGITGLHRFLTIFLYMESIERWRSKFKDSVPIRS